MHPANLNNSPLIEQTLTLRKQQAQLLGFDTYADLSIARKMAPSVDAVEKLSWKNSAVLAMDAAIQGIGKS